MTRWHLGVSLVTACVRGVFGRPRKGFWFAAISIAHRIMNLLHRSLSSPCFKWGDRRMSGTGWGLQAPKILRLSASMQGSFAHISNCKANVIISTILCTWSHTYPYNMPGSVPMIQVSVLETAQHRGFLLFDRFQRATPKTV